MSPLFVDLSDGSSKTARTHRQSSSFASPRRDPPSHTPADPALPPGHRVPAFASGRSSERLSHQRSNARHPEHALARLLIGSWLAVRVATAAGHEPELIAGEWNPAVRRKLWAAQIGARKRVLGVSQSNDLRTA
jgi:hypothetical protein